MTQVRNLEVDDLVAWEFMGTVVSGRVKHIAYCAYDLGPGERIYMQQRNLIIPDNENDALGGMGQTLVFLEIHVPGREARFDHAYLDIGQLIAVFEDSMAKHRKKDS